MRPGKLVDSGVTTATRPDIGTILRLTRPVFLLGGVLLCLLGTALGVQAKGTLSIPRYLLAQLLVTSIQLLAQYANEYFDVEADRLNSTNRTWFSGGSGVLPAGEVELSLVNQFLRGLLGLSIIVAFVAGVVSPFVLPIAILSILIAWYYSAPPLSLMGSGWGELSASIVVAVLVPMTGYVLQTGMVNGGVMWLCLPLVSVHMAMLMAFELPDYESDTQAGKHTLSVRLGYPRAVQVQSILLIGSMISLPVVWAAFPIAQLFWLLLPLGLGQIVLITTLSRSSSIRRYHFLTLTAVALFTACGVYCFAAVLFTVV